jgi:cation:H+ antiporter
LKTKPFAAFGKWIHTFDSKYQRVQLGWFLLGIVVLLFASDVVVKVGAKLAGDLGIPILFVGMFVVALGTSLPELAFQMKAIRGKQFTAVWGDLLGSLVANSTLILGLAAVISPIKLFNGQIAYFNSVMVFLLGFFLLWSFMKSKLRVSRIEGLVLLAVYLLFILVEMGVM